MIFDRFRRKGGDSATEPQEREIAAADDEASNDADDSELEHVEVIDETPWGERAAAVIPGGSSTGSKRPSVIYGDDEMVEPLPTHYSRARGASLFLVDGDTEIEVIDCTMALGSVALSYAD